MTKRPKSTPVEYVASGNYVVSEKKKAVLEAYLGTCVGVALCDREAGVGGLAHVLLPEPTGLDKAWKAGAYATTGLPLFMQALCDAGAKKDRLRATIAGGALVGPVSRQDLDLDIGGRTTDVVYTILKEQGIRIGKSETGGYFCCRLGLDLQTMDCSIHPIGQPIPSGEKNFERPMSVDIESATQLVRPIPQVALKIARMIQNGDYNIREVGTEVKQDQVISAKVIRLCNSSFLGLKRRIDSIDRALVILGEKTLLKLVVSASLELYFSDAGQGYSLCKGGLFQHALRTGIVAEEMAKFTGQSSTDIAYTAGLLHDIGKVVLDQYIALIYPFFYRRTQIDGIGLCEAEGERLGITHPEAGGRLAENWLLPENLTEAIRYHHDPQRATLDPGLTHLVYLADLLMSRFQVGQELECLNMDSLSSSLGQLGLMPSQFPIIVDLIPHEIFDASFTQSDLGLI